MSSTEPDPALDPQDRARLIGIARDSVSSGLDAGRPCDVNLEQCSPTLRLERATFVTLEIDKQLRGCIGSLEAHRALALDVAANAWSAAFRDPRFTPLSVVEADGLAITISILSPHQPMSVEDENHLLAQLRPGIDGLVLEEDERRATFLPSVWASLEDPRAFLSQLRRKAGMPSDYWSERMRFKRYTTDTFQS